MILDAILQRILNASPRSLVGWLFALLFLTGIAGSLVVPFFMTMMDRTKKAQEKARRMIPAQAQARINDLSRRVMEAHDRETHLRKENHELRRLVAAETNFGRNHRADVHAVLKSNT